MTDTKRVGYCRVNKITLRKQIMYREHRVKSVLAVFFYVPAAGQMIFILACTADKLSV